MSIYANSSGTSKSRKKFCPARTQSSEISNFGNIFAISEWFFGAIWIPLFFQKKTGISVSSMITMFSIISSIFKTCTMLNAVQANLLVSQKVIKGAHSAERAFKSGGNVSFVFKFLFRYFFYFLRNKLTCMFQTLTAYLHEELDLCFFSIAYQQVLRLLFCLENLIFLLIHSTAIKVELS